MKRTILLSATLLALSFPAFSQFEGVVESRNITTDETGAMQQYVMTMWVRGEMVKIAVPPAGQNPGTTMIYRRDKKRLWMLNEKEKTYFEVMLSDQGNQKEPQGVDALPSPKVTGKKKTILGYPCDQLLLDNGENVTEYWGTKKLGDLTRAVTRVFSGMSSDQSSPLDDEIARMGYYPLLVQTRLQGKIVESSEVTRIDVRRVSPEIFEVPPDYRKEGVKDRIEKEGVE